jgi:hypothetical protein
MELRRLAKLAVCARGKIFANRQSLCWGVGRGRARFRKPKPHRPTRRVKLIFDSANSRLRSAVGIRGAGRPWPISNYNNLDPNQPWQV